ncbi:MAG: hypothetical protein IJE97_01610 [Thermoguttaceae bacterium]|nr:hypothetical protein [Thermoguttaceae bacterium]
MKRTLPSASDVLYRRFRRAVVSTALVAAFPAFPVFADPPTPPTQQPVAQSKPTATPQTRNGMGNMPTAREIEDALAAFDVSLFEIPDGKSAAFYLERLDALANELRRVVSDYQTRQRDAGEKVLNADPNLFLLAPMRIARGGEYALPEADASTPVRYLAARQSLYRRLADSPELPSDVRDYYYSSWLSFDSMFAVPRTPEEERDFLAAQLAEEEAKSPLNLGRVLILRKLWRSAVEASERQSSFVAPAERPLEQADVEKLFDVPEGESVEFYAARRDKLTTSTIQTFIHQANSEELTARYRAAVDDVSTKLAKALQTEAQAFDREGAERLLDVPKGESAEFYLARLKELSDLERQILNYRRRASYRDLDALENRVASEALPTVYQLLADADDLTPLERFEYFEKWVEICVSKFKVDALQNARDVALGLDSPSEIDAIKPDYLTLAILRARLRAVALSATQARAQASAGLPVAANSEVSKLPAPLPQDKRDELLAVADELADRAADGPLPWTLGKSWASVAEESARQIDEIDRNVGTRFRKNVLATLGDSDSANVNLARIRRNFAESIRAAEFIGYAVPVEAQNLDGTPFDWASYRGAPVLVEIVRLDERGLLIGKRRSPFHIGGFDLLANYEKVDLRRFTLVVAPLENARRFAENEKEGVANGANSTISLPIVCAKSEGRPNGNNLTTDYGLVWSQCWVLFDADGRVLAASPLPMQAQPQRYILNELQRLFPDVSTAPSPSRQVD